MNQHFNKFKKIVNASKLKEEDKKFLENIFVHAKQEELKLFIDGLEKFPDFLLVLTYNLRAKDNLLKVKQLNKWPEIVKKEIRDLDMLVKKYK